MILRATKSSNHLTKKVKSYQIESNLNQNLIKSKSNHTNQAKAKDQIRLNNLD